MTVGWKTRWKQYPRHTAAAPIMTLRKAIWLAERPHGRSNCKVLLELTPGANEPRWDRVTLVDTDNCVCYLDEPAYHLNRWLAEARAQAKAGTDILAPFHAGCPTQPRWLPLAPITRLRRARGLSP